MKITANWSSFLRKNNFDVSLLKPKDHLHPSLWRQKRLNPAIASRLLEIAQEVIDTEDIKAGIKDIVITGSLASYNWSRLSDLDLHILLDFNEIDENRTIVKKYLNVLRINWNKKHEIRIENHEVELYFQDINETHHSVGMYSLFTTNWLQEPRLDSRDVDLKTVEKKAEAIAIATDHVSDLFIKKEYDEAYEFASKLMRKLKRMRISGLSREGVYSVENLAFKMARNAGIIDKISFLKITSYDKKMSLSMSDYKSRQFRKNV